MYWEMENNEKPVTLAAKLGYGNCWHGDVLAIPGSGSIKDNSLRASCYRRVDGWSIDDQKHEACEEEQCGGGRPLSSRRIFRFELGRFYRIVFFTGRILRRSDP